MARATSDASVGLERVLVNTLVYRLWKLFLGMVAVAVWGTWMYHTTTHDVWDAPCGPGGHVRTWTRVFGRRSTQNTMDSSEGDPDCAILRPGGGACPGDGLSAIDVSRVKAVPQAEASERQCTMEQQVRARVARSSVWASESDALVRVLFLDTVAFTVMLRLYFTRH
jgi:hypothetical protein